MRFCIVGAGAIGGLVGARLALAGHDVTFIARGPHLAALRAGGVRLRHPDGREDVARVAATADFAAAGQFDAVILAMKAHHVAGVVGSLGALCHGETVILPMQNGIPFWYFHEHGGELAGRTVEAVDPGGVSRKGIPAQRIVGCVVYLASELAAPANVSHRMGERLILGELDGSASARVQALSEAFTAARFKCPVVPDIRSQVWIKLWGNATFNPISALTRTTLSQICADPDGRDLAAQMMRETRAVAEKLGARFDLTPEERMEQAARVGGHKTSMLQDVEAGRALEIDALVGAVVEMGGIAGVPTPTISAIYRAGKLLDRALAAEVLRQRAAAMPAE